MGHISQVSVYEAVGCVVNQIGPSSKKSGAAWGVGINEAQKAGIIVHENKTVPSINLGCGSCLLVMFPVVSGFAEGILSCFRSSLPNAGWFQAVCIESFPHVTTQHEDDM